MDLVIKDLGGAVDYQECYEAMESFTLNRDGKSADEFWLLEHKPVYTRGVRSKDEAVPDTEIDVVQSNRGGLMTYHGPGQLIGYMLFDLRRLNMGIRDLVTLTEDLLLQTLARNKIHANRIDGAPGLYVNDAKIAAMGFRVKNGCSYHGFSLNVAMDLTPYENINACGLNLDATMMSEYDETLTVAKLKEQIIYRWLGWYDGHFAAKNNFSHA